MPSIVPVMTAALADLPFWALYATMLGWALARGTFFYAVGSATHHPRLAPLTARFTTGPIGTALARVESGGARAVTGTYVVPGLAAATQVVAGMVGMDRRRYAVGFVAAAAPWAVVEALAGNVLLTVLTSGWAWALLAVAGGALVVRHSHRLPRLALGPRPAIA